MIETQPPSKDSGTSAVTSRPILEHDESIHQVTAAMSALNFVPSQVRFGTKGRAGFPRKAD
jgi:hypothetical protein